MNSDNQNFQQQLLSLLDTADFRDDPLRLEMQQWWQQARAGAAPIQPALIPSRLGSDEQAVQHALLDNSLCGIVLTHGRVIQYCNTRFAQMFGYTPSELLGRPTRIVYPNDEAFLRVQQAYQEMQLQGLGQLQTVQFAHKDGSRVQCDLSGILLPGDEQSVWTLVDVSLREQQSQRLLRHTRFNALLAEANRMGLIVESEQALYDAVCQAAVAHGAMLRAWIGRPEGASGQFEVLAAAGALDDLQQTDLVTPADATDGNDPTRQAWHRDQAIFLAGAFAALPIHRQGQIVAVLTACCPQDNVFDDEVRALFVALASAIESGLRGLWQRQCIAQLQGLYRALMNEGDVVLQARSELEMLQSTCEKLVDGTPFHGVLVGRPDARGQGEVLARAGSGTRQLETLRLNLIDHGETSMMMRAWSTQTLIFDNNRLADARLDQMERDFCQAHGWHALLAAPVLRAGKIWAVLVFVSRQINVFDSQTMELCQVVAALLGHGLDEMDLKQQLSELQKEESQRARHDILTGLPNRYAMELHLTRAVSQARRRGTVLALGLIDLDDFKPVNDTWGHAAGDRLLYELAQRLQSRLRDSDLLARLGGDEFIIIIEDLDQNCINRHLTDLLSRLHQAVEQPFDIGPGQNALVGMSMGLALFPRDADDGDVLMHQADNAMYQAKQHKHDREHWWSFPTPGAEKPAREAVFTAYSSEAAALMSKYRNYLQSVVERFIQHFAEELARTPQSQAILAALNHAEIQALLQRQATHFRFLLDPETTQEMIQHRARRLGQVHALVGVNSAMLTQTFALCRQVLGERLNRELLPARERYHILRTAESRVQDDIQAELLAGQETTDTYQRILASPLPAGAELWADALHRETMALAGLPGIRACEVIRPNANGVFQVEASTGEAADEIFRILCTPGLQATLAAHQSTDSGLIPTAWRSGQLTSTADYMRDARTRAWHHELQSLTLALHGTVMIPIPAANGVPVMVLALYGSYPNQFCSPWMQQFAMGLQQRWAMIWQHCSTPASNGALSQSQAQDYRQRLFDGGLMMALQPIIDLRSGAMIKAEALARLRMPDGQIIPPAIFLPLLGTAELGQLFRLGLEQALSEVLRWKKQGLSLQVALNLPPSVLGNPHCLSWVKSGLERHHLPPGCLSLELQETPHQDKHQQDKAIRQLTQLGVGLAMDDLGAGDSSLQRLSGLPINAIKIAQGLLADLYTNPTQTMSLTGALIQMGQDFEREVVVEGLEDQGMLEAAVLLGAPYGQGYALARPMPADQLLVWNRAARLPPPAPGVSTFVGALAYHWQLTHHQGGQHPHDIGDCPLTSFLAGLGAEGRAARAWHLQIHAEPQRPEAALRLRQWLTQQIHGQAPDGA
jgi:diguanylate cyclase (GGDEF)-like protein/PAS domain S-box-containing protein